MRRTVAYVFVAFVSIVALGISSQPALAQSGDANPSNIHVTLTDTSPLGVSPDAVAPVLGGPVAFVLPPPSGGPPPSWPCFTPKAPCQSDPAGGMLMGLPLQQWPISGATNCTLVPCGQIQALFQTTTGQGAISFTINIKQGTTTIFNQSFPNVGTATAHQVGVVDLTGVQLRPNAVAGPATITVATTIGSNHVSGKTTIYLQ